MANQKWNRGRIVAAIRAWADENGRPPKVKDWQHRTAHHPSSTVVMYWFRTWADAIEAAGFARPELGRPPRPPGRCGNPPHASQRAVPVGDKPPNLMPIRDQLARVVEANRSGDRLALAVELELLGDLSKMLARGVRRHGPYARFRANDSFAPGMAAP
jgi:hypothetical protein